MYRDEAVRRTYLLCRELLEYLPSPRGSLDTLPGLAESRRVPCTACSARGRVQGRKNLPCVACPPILGPHAPVSGPVHGCRPCLGCDGRGWRRRRKGEEAWDEYAGVPVGEPGTRHDDRQLERVDLVLRLWESPEAVEVEWEARRQRLFRQGSFAELLVALELLRASLPNRHRLLWRVVVLGWADLENPSRGMLRLSEERLAELNATLHHVAHDLMPSRIRVPYHLRPESQARLRKDALWRGQTPAARAARAARDEEIRMQRFELGWKIARIAKHHGLDERRVKQLLREESRTKESAA